MAYGFSETENATRAIILNKHFIIFFFFFTFCGVQSRVPTRCNMQLQYLSFSITGPFKGLWIAAELYIFPAYNGRTEDSST